MRWLLSLALLVAVAVTAEMRQDAYVYRGRTNASPAALTELGGLAGDARGELERIIVTVGGVNTTNTLIITDSDGYVLLSNLFITGTTTTWFNLTNLPFIGVIVQGSGAVPTNNASVPTNTVKILYNRN